MAEQGFGVIIRATEVLDFREKGRLPRFDFHFSVFPSAPRILALGPQIKSPGLASGALVIVNFDDASLGVQLDRRDAIAQRDFQRPVLFLELLRWRKCPHAFSLCRLLDMQIGVGGKFIGWIKVKRQ